MHINKTLLLFLAIVHCPAFLHAQKNEDWKSWNQPHEPFRIMGNIYYVGASEIASYLVTTSKGHILLDGGFAETVPIILANIKQLGFNPRDVKLLLNSQAHFDHAGGLAELKRQTGARMLASEEDGKVLSTGGKNDFFLGDKYRFEPVSVDQNVADRVPVKLDNVEMVPVLTPGHTKGCTTWTTRVRENGKDVNIVFLCGLTILPGTDLVHNKTYPNIASDFERSFAILRKLPCDLLLGAHGGYYHLDKKYKAFKNGKITTNPFINSEELAAYVDQKEQDSRTLIRSQKKQSQGN